MFNERVNIDTKAKEAGFRNFTSFIFIFYFGKKKSLWVCARIIGVSYHKLRTSVIRRGYPIREKSRVPRKTGNRLDLYAKVRYRTEFIFPWCAVHSYYYKRLLTTYEVANVIGISQTSLIKLMGKWKMKRRKQGVRKFY